MLILSASLLYPFSPSEPLGNYVAEGFGRREREEGNRLKIKK
jgi:hypothetical protein